MTDRITLSFSDDAGRYLRKQAEVQTCGNVTAYVEKLARYQQVRDSAASFAAWYANHPDHAEAVAAEQAAADVEQERGAA
ncbi:hypothetical protein [Nocardia sp. NBC_00511]|uniref:hypothetical protein n=1 Tax=Nocardia sp. NBC_00511 TaxID=2903591 RepID=UPI002F90D04E